MTGNHIVHKLYVMVVLEGHGVLLWSGFDTLMLRFHYAHKGPKMTLTSVMPRFGMNCNGRSVAYWLIPNELIGANT